MMTRRSSPQSLPSPTSKMAVLDLPLHAVGFEYGILSPKKLTSCVTFTKAYFQVLLLSTSARNYQSFTLKIRETPDQLPVAGMCLLSISRSSFFSGMTAMIAEDVASLGAYITSSFRRITGIHLSTNHIRAAHLSELVKVKATHIQQGRNIQVWEVQLWKINPLASADKKMLLSTSRVTLMCNLPSYKEMKGFEDIIKKLPLCLTGRKVSPRKLDDLLHFR